MGKGEEEDCGWAVRAVGWGFGSRTCGGVEEGEAGGVVEVGGADVGAGLAAVGVVDEGVDDGEGVSGGSVRDGGDGGDEGGEGGGGGGGAVVGGAGVVLDFLEEEEVGGA